MATPSLAARRPEIVLAVLLSLCLVVLSLQVRRPDGRTAGESWLLTAISPFVDIVASVRGGAGDLAEWAATRRSLLRENGALRDETVRMQGEILRLREAEGEKTRLLELLGAYPFPPAGTHPARLIAVESGGTFRTALLDRGSSDGLQVGGVVVSRGGLLGRIIALGPTTARVQLLSDKTAAVGVVLARGPRAAVAKGDGRGVTVRYVPTIDPVEKNDVIVTSGTDGVYPSGLPVGRVAGVSRNSTLFWDIQVDIAADPGLESMVFVLPPVRKSDVTTGPPVTGGKPQG
jgi:rod shape-determining protein MreC